jgi:hypothetical protein
MVHTDVPRVPDAPAHENTYSADDIDASGTVSKGLHGYSTSLALERLQVASTRPMFPLSVPRVANAPKRDRKSDRLVYIQGDPM